MGTKKAISIGIIAIIFIATLAFFAVKMAGKDSSVSSPLPVQTSKSAQPKAGDSVQTATQTDSDVAGLEADLNSVSEEDFGDANLSDSAVGL